MSSNHVVVWLDHAEAHIIHFTRDASEVETVRTHSTHPHLHIKSGVTGSGRAPENAQYFDDVAKVINDSLEILVVGPGFEKFVFVKYLLKHHHDLVDKIISVESIDHPSDGQLLAYARKYFIRADRLR
jgi:stalled ribosome rescue protein Dom34